MSRHRLFHRTILLRAQRSSGIDMEEVIESTTIGAAKMDNFGIENGAMAFVEIGERALQLGCS